MNNFYAFPLFRANRHELHSGRDPIVPECFGGVLRRTQREEQVSPFFRKGYFFVRSNSFSSNWLFSTHIQKKLASACFKKIVSFLPEKKKRSPASNLNRFSSSLKSDLWTDCQRKRKRECVCVSVIEREGREDKETNFLKEAFSSVQKNCWTAPLKYSEENLFKFNFPQTQIETRSKNSSRELVG